MREPSHRAAAHCWLPSSEGHCGLPSLLVPDSSPSLHSACSHSTEALCNEVNAGRQRSHQHCDLGPHCLGPHPATALTHILPELQQWAVLQVPLPLESAAWLFSRKQSMHYSAVRQVSAECIVCVRLFWQSAQRTLAPTGCRPVIATNPYVIMVILVAWSWLVGLLSLAPYKCELTYVLDASAQTQRAVRLLAASHAAGASSHSRIVAAMRTGHDDCWKLAASYESLTAALLCSDVLGTALVAEA